MRWRFAEHAEIIDRGDDPPADQVMPDSVHDHPRDQRVLCRIGDLAGEFESATAGAGERRAAKRFEEPPRDTVAEILRVAADENRFVPRAAIEHGRSEVRRFRQVGQDSLALGPEFAERGPGFERVAAEERIDLESGRFIARFLRETVDRGLQVGGRETKSARRGRRLIRFDHGRNREFGTGCGDFEMRSMPGVAAQVMLDPAKLLGGVELLHERSVQWALHHLMGLYGGVGEPAAANKVVNPFAAERHRWRTNGFAGSHRFAEIAGIVLSVGFENRPSGIEDRGRARIHAETVPAENQVAGASGTWAECGAVRPPIRRRRGFKIEERFRAGWLGGNRRHGQRLGEFLEPLLEFGRQLRPNRGAVP